LVQPELKGNIEFMSLGTLLSVHCSEQLSGRLVIEADAVLAGIFLDQGEIVHAVFNSEIGENAFYKILALKKGVFSLYPNQKSPQITISKTWSSLLLDATRRLDENSNAIQENINWDELDLFGAVARPVMRDPADGLLAALAKVPGIQQLSLLSADLQIIDGNSATSLADQLPFLAALHAAVLSLGAQFSAGSVRYLVYKNRENLILVPDETALLLLEVEKNIIPDLLVNEVFTLIKRYR
jgi:hypothetical protein